MIDEVANFAFWANNREHQEWVCECTYRKICAIVHSDSPDMTDVKARLVRAVHAIPTSSCLIPNT